MPRAHPGMNCRIIWPARCDVSVDSHGLSGDAEVCLWRGGNCFKELQPPVRPQLHLCQRERVSSLAASRRRALWIGSWMRRGPEAWAVMVAVVGLTADPADFLINAA